MLRLLKDSATTATLELKQWNGVLAQAYRTGLLPRLGWQLLHDDPHSRVPDAVRASLESACTISDHVRRGVRWEVNRIEHALRRTDAQVVLLKGAAYIMADLPNGPGRLVSDVDILVPKDRLLEVEQALLEHGWESLKRHEYDDHYYRAWMHELPPLFHPGRRSIIDVHHTLLPPLGRLQLDPAALFEAARPLPGSRFYVLAPEDMILHSAAHLFQEENLSGGLRDLVDLDCLLRHFADVESDFWSRLPSRADQLGLNRTLYYTVRFLRQILHTPMPDELIAQADAWKPKWPVPQIMDRLGALAMLPSHFERHPQLVAGANSLLYVRAHWLKMPPRLLLKHLLSKLQRSWFPPQAAEA